jgi:hypothetical protein
MLTRVRIQIRTVVAVIGLATPHLAPAADSGPCSAPEYRQFDFRLGSYSVTTRTSQPAGSALVESTLDGCMLVEYWTGAISGQGRAHYFYDRNDGFWRLVFVNDEGGRLIMVGRLVDGAMVFSGVNHFGEFNGLQRMTWTPLPEGRVSQHWELSAGEGEPWRTVFMGLYTPRNAVPR